MRPSNNLFALIKAYDTNYSPAKDLKEFRTQSQLFLDEIEPYCHTVNRAMGKTSRADCGRQNHFDAMVSIAYDMGLDLFNATKLPALACGMASNAAMRHTRLALPCFNNTLRNELAESMRQYNMEYHSRRELEYKLWCGQPVFTIGRTKIGDRIVFAPSVLHPVYSFLMALANHR